MVFRSFARLLLACGVAAFATVPAQSQPYPNKPIRIVVPYAVGGGLDVLARMIGEGLFMREVKAGCQTILDKIKGP